MPTPTISTEIVLLLDQSPPRNLLLNHNRKGREVHPTQPPLQNKEKILVIPNQARDPVPEIETRENLLRNCGMKNHSTTTGKITPTEIVITTATTTTTTIITESQTSITEEEDTTEEDITGMTTIGEGTTTIGEGTTTIGEDITTIGEGTTTIGEDVEEGGSEEEEVLTIITTTIGTRTETMAITIILATTETITITVGTRMKITITAVATTMEI